MHLNKNPAPTLSWTRSYCKKMYRPRAFAKDHICVCARNCNLSHKQAPSSNQNKPSQVKVKVTEQRSSPLKVLSFPRLWSNVSPQPWHKPKFYWFQWKWEACKDCRTLPSIWHLGSFQYDTTAFGIWKIISKTWLGLPNLGAITTFLKCVLFYIAKNVPYS